MRYVDGEGTTYLHRDQLNSVRTISDTAGLRAKRTIYLPFGETIDYNVDPTLAEETKGFIGERYDEDAGLQYLNARYYDVTVRWWRSGAAPMRPVTLLKQRNARGGVRPAA